MIRFRLSLWILFGCLLFSIAILGSRSGTGRWISNLGYITLVHTRLRQNSMETPTQNVRALRDLLDAENLFGHALAVDPDLQSARIGLAETLLAGGSAQAAKDILAPLLSDTRQDKPRVEYLCGEASVQLDDIPKAVTYLSAAGAYQQLIALCDDLSLIDRLREALDCYEAASNIQPSGLWPLLAAGTKSYQLGNYERAEYWLRQAVHVAPGNSQVHEELAQTLYARASDVGPAIEHVEIAVALEPGALRPVL